MPTLTRSLLVSALLVSSLPFAGAQQKRLPLSPLPMMGWSSWNHYGKKVTEADMRANADAIVKSGLRDAGYVYVNLDGSWEMPRDAKGEMGINKERFTDMKALGDYIHSKGLKFGIYSSPGPKTCGGFEASFGHEEKDAQTFADWGADYLKYDLCTFREKMKAVEDAPGGTHRAAVDLEIAAYKKMEQSLIMTGRPMLYALCQYGGDYVWQWGPSVGATMWRTTHDIAANYYSMTDVGFALAGLSKYAGKGHYNDPDSLEVGNEGISPEEGRMQMSLWSIAAAPLILGNDVSHMDATTLEILSNKEVIAIDQDPLVEAGDRLWAEGMQEIWTRHLDQGRMAVALFNRSTQPTEMTLDLKQVGWKGRSATARDVWKHENAEVKGKKVYLIPRHGVALVVLSK